VFRPNGGYSSVSVEGRLTVREACLPGKDEKLSQGGTSRDVVSAGERRCAGSAEGSGEKVRRGGVPGHQVKTKGHQGEHNNGGGGRKKREAKRKVSGKGKEKPTLKGRGQSLRKKERRMKKTYFRRSCFFGHKKPMGKERARRTEELCLARNPRRMVGLHNKKGSALS